LIASNKLIATKIFLPYTQGFLPVLERELGHSTSARYSVVTATMID
jgi:hypothetical protein